MVAITDCIEPCCTALNVANPFAKSFPRYFYHNYAAEQNTLFFEKIWKTIWSTVFMQFFVIIIIIFAWCWQQVVKKVFSPFPVITKFPSSAWSWEMPNIFFFLLPGTSHRSYPKDITGPFNVSMFCCHHEEPFPAEGPTSSPFHHCRHHCSENVTKYGETFCRRVILCNNNRNPV